jgi:myosin heavy chain 6/7
LEKNKDPVNDTVVDVLKRASNNLLVHLWREHPGQSNPPEEDKSKKKKKGGGAKTVSSVYLVQLAELMGTLHATEPHFIRCIVPNTHKQPLVVETELIMHQLTCNGVLEGIRVCMLGFPNRMLYPDFKARYAILGAAEIASSNDNKVSVRALMTKINFPVEKYQLGHTKVFFRAGALAGLEEVRDTIVLKLVRFMQGQCYGLIRRKVYNVKNDQRELMKVIQRNFRKFQSMREWGWFIIIQKTRPLIGRINLEEELRILEEKAKSAYGAYEEAVNITKELEAANAVIQEETAALTKQLESEQGNLSVYTDRQAKAAKMKADNEQKLDAAQKALAAEEVAKQQMTADRKTMEGDISIVKKDIEDLDLAFQKLEQEKTNRDHTIRSLTDEVCQQDEVINKLNKEKKMIGDTQSKAYDDLHVAEEKVAHLNDIKAKLEATLDELEGGVAAEKRTRAGVDSQRRKVEGDFKMAQETVSEIELAKRDLENIIARKEKDILGLSGKLDEEQSLVTKATKAIKEHQGRVEELEEELDAERQARAKAEKQRADLAKEMERIGDRLGDAGGASAAQLELNKKRETEVGRLRKDLEEATINNESVLMSLKKKHQDAIQEMTEQIDCLAKAKSKIEKDKAKISSEAADARAATEEVARGKASSEKSNKSLLGSLNDFGKKVEEANMTLGDFESHKKRLAAENADLLRVVGDINNNVNMILKMKSSLASALDDAKHIADTEAQERHLLVGKFKNLESELDALKGHYDEEVTGRDELIRQTKKAEGEAATWRSKFEMDAVGKAEELEMVKMKLQARLTEAETATDNLSAKLANIEKGKGKLQGEINEAAVNLDQAVILNNLMEKKAKQFDKLVGEWKAKAAGLGMDLDVAQMECRNASSELFKVKNAYEEGVAHLEEVRRENKVLSNEIKDIMDQISEGGRSIHEIDKIRKRLAAEKLELQAALEEAEGALEQEENKVLRAQIELTQIRKEVDHRIAEKEEQFLGIKKNMTKGIEGMQAALEAEAKGKAEALRMKKKNLKVMLVSLRLLWIIPMQTMLILKRPSRLTKAKSEVQQPNLMMSKELRNLQGIPLLHLRKRLLLSQMV